MCIVMSYRKSVPFLAAMLLLLSVLSCTDPNAYFIVGDKDQQRELRQLFAYLQKEPEAGENRFTIIHQIAGILMSSGYSEKLNLFLTTYVERFPNDPFNSYYLFIVGQNYLSMKARPMAALYFERVLKNHPDILIRGDSIHYICLNALIDLVEEPEYRVNYYKELIARFGDRIDQGTTVYSLAKTYEQLGEWDQAIQSYQKFLKYPDTVITGHPDAYRNVRDMLEFANSSRGWAMEDLNDLIDTIKNAIRNRNVRELERYRAKVNFFAMSWEQEESDANSQVIFDLGTFLRNSKVGYSPTLDIDSNATEAYLRTWGWSYRIRTWYLYFRKIRFPADPEINGRWEWAGIYFGEKL